MKLSDLVSGSVALTGAATLCGKGVVVRLVPEGVLGDMRASLGAPVYPEDDKNAALMALYQGECKADRARFNLLELAASVGVTAEIRVTRATDGGAERSKVETLTAAEACEREAAGARNVVAEWVGQVLPTMGRLTQADLLSVRTAYDALLVRATGADGVGALVGDAEKKSGPVGG